MLPRDPSLPPEVFHIVPILGSAIAYGNDPLNFFARCKEKVRRVLLSCQLPVKSCFQYGNVFTFVLLGRRVTVALSAKGNNFILGGKSTAFSAEDAYTVG